MASKRNCRKSACTGKIPHHSKQSALDHFHQMKRNGKEIYGLEVYRCQFCGFYHLGHRFNKRK
jgi:hypothetical protein